MGQWLRVNVRHPWWAFQRLVQWLSTGGWEYRWESNASYLRVRRGKVARTDDSVGNGEYIIDFDRWGNILGIEILAHHEGKQLDG